MSNVRALQVLGTVSLASLYATAVPGRPSARPANLGSSRCTSAPALEWAVRRARGQRTASSAWKSGTLSSVPTRCRQVNCQ